MSISRVEHVPYAVAGFGDTLTHDLAHGVPSATAFFPARNVSDVLKQIDARSHPREQVAAVLAASAQRMNAPAEVLANIRKLREPKTYVVATGQQAGLLGGPLYVLHKALTAVKLAQQYEAQAHGGARFVPVFWVAGDDHDLAEIDHTFFLQPGGGVERLQAPLTAESTGRSACEAVLDGSAPLSEKLKALGIDTQAAEELAGVYRGSSMSDAFARLLYKWLGSLGLIVVQSSEMRPFARDLIAKDLADHDIVTRLLQESAFALQKSGYTPGFAKPNNAPHFFIRSEPSGVRANLDVDAGGGEVRERSASFATRGAQPRTFKRAEMEQLIRARPELFSASAALRPVVQEAIFPVAAVVLGPGEIAYWAQLKKVHDHFNVVWPVVEPRASITLIDGLGQKMIRKLELSGVQELFADAESLKRRVNSGANVASSIAERAKKIVAELDAIAAEVSEVDAGLKPLFEKSRARIAHELQRVDEKTRAVLQERDGVGQNRLRYAASLVRPKNSPQERVLGCAQFMLKHPALAADLLQVIDPADRRHLVAYVD